MFNIEILRSQAHVKMESLVSSKSHNMHVVSILKLHAIYFSWIFCSIYVVIVLVHFCNSFSAHGYDDASFAHVKWTFRHTVFVP